ncbi:MAG: tetratricopeptide repeat protein [Pirellula sp.]|jgi:tetratricopeptide (TPR) repeat protein|nr:tetratricopeptide repeat protein [Pirellula sp.]
MNASENVSSSSIGNKLLSRYSDTDSLFAKPAPLPAATRTTAIPLQRTQELEQSIKHSPAIVEPYIELSQIYLEQERWVDARRILEAGKQNCPENETVLLLHEDLMLILSAQLLENAKKELAQRPCDDTRHTREQAEINLVNERIRVCRERYHRNPNQKDILITWAIALRQQKKYDEAIALLTQAVKDLSLRARASLQMGMCHQALERPLDALSCFRRAALFRSPPPDPKVASVALELAAALSEENGLIDSSIFYLENLAKLLSKEEKQAILDKIERLKPHLPQSYS